MKKYVLIVPSISNMGGAQMYIRNKVLFMRNLGWEVDVITATRGEVIIEELKDFNKSKPELAFDYYCYGKRKRKQIVDQLCRWINDREKCYEEIVLESTCVPECTWAESVARIIGARSFCFLLQEQNVISNKGLQKFFVFKHKRKELVGMVRDTLKYMFEPFWPISQEESYFLTASCNNVTADIDHPLLHIIDKSKYDFIVGTLSRLDKPFVIPAIKSLCKYANSHRDKKFLYLLMGGAPDTSTVSDEIKKTISEETENVELLMTGYIYPVPTKLLEMCDAHFTSAGSCVLCARCGVPTISIDSNDLKPIGVFGRTTQNALFRGENEPPIGFDDLMNDILFEKLYDKQEANYQANQPNFESHIAFLEGAENKLDYFDMDSIKVESAADKKLKLALALIGPKNYLRLGALKENLRNKRMK